MASAVDRPFLVGAAFVLALAVVVYALAPLITLFLLALFLAYIANPLVTRLEGAGIPRSATILLLLFVVLLAITALVVALIPMIRAQVVTFSAHVPVYVAWLERELTRMTHGRYTIDVHDMARHLLQQWRSLGPDAARVLSIATYSGLRLLAWLAQGLLVLVVTFYLLRDWDDILRVLHETIPARRREAVTAFAREVDATLGRLLRGQLSLMLALAFLYATGLTAAGLDLAIPIGVVTGFASIIPYLGFFAGLVTASLAALMQYHDLDHLLPVFAVFGFTEVMESMVLGPRLVGRSIGLHPVVVIFAVLAGGRLLGFAGILLALPVSTVAMTGLRRLRARDPMSAGS